MCRRFRREEKSWREFSDKGGVCQVFLIFEFWFLLFLEERERRAVKKKKSRGTKENEEALLICFFFWGSTLWEGLRFQDFHVSVFDLFVILYRHFPYFRCWMKVSNFKGPTDYLFFPFGFKQLSNFYLFSLNENNQE